MTDFDFITSTRNALLSWTTTSQKRERRILELVELKSMLKELSLSNPIWLLLKVVSLSTTFVIPLYSRFDTRTDSLSAVGNVRLKSSFLIPNFRLPPLYIYSFSLSIIHRRSSVSTYSNHLQINHFSLPCNPFFHSFKNHLFSHSSNIYSKESMFLFYYFTKNLG